MDAAITIKNTLIELIQADITSLSVDAIVNAANNKLVMGGGVAGAIKRKGGRIIEDEAVKKAPIKIGEAIWTKAGKLPCKFVIHAVTMGMPACRQAGNFETDQIKIRDSMRNTLKLAEELRISSIAIPALGCGTGGFPYLASAKIMSQEIFRHLRATESCLSRIVFCVYDNPGLDMFKKGAIGYLKYVTTVLQNGPFITVDVIIEVSSKGMAPEIVLIQRSNPPFGWALPGGFVDYGESLENAAAREAYEETGLKIKDLRQFHTYSEPERDPRFHTIGTVFIANAEGRPKAGDDAASVKVVGLSEIEKMDLAFDHKKIINDYIQAAKLGRNASV